MNRISGVCPAGRPGSDDPRVDVLELGAVEALHRQELSTAGILDAQLADDAVDRLTAKAAQVTGELG